jgi:hypothetical protein
MMRIFRFVSTIFCLALLIGCATSRSYMRLDISDASATVTRPTGKAVVIDAVQDERRFEDDPPDPSVPSLKHGDDYKLDAAERKRAIARKRNGWGKAIGDILLEDGQTVETITRDLVAEGFARHGYQVLAPGAPPPPDAVHVQVDINEFWAWFTPGMWTVDMEGRIHTLIRTGSGVQLDVRAYGKNSGASGKEDNWREAYDRAFKDYEARFDEAFGRAGL